MDLREKLLVLLAAGITIAGIYSPRFADQLPDETIEQSRWEIEMKYEEYERSKSDEERKGSQYPD